MKYDYDAFICHASEDKDTFVRKLAEELAAVGLNIWYDEFTITVGDSLFWKINEGLKQSKYGIVIFSQAFFDKKWPRRELEGLVALEEEGQKKILPVWFNVKRDDILQNYPILADLYAADASKGLETVVSELLKVLSPKDETTEENYIQPTVFFHDRTAGAFPGLRGLYETSDKDEIISRLSILLRDPLQFKGYYPSFMMFDMRGGTMDISRFRVLDEDHVIIVHDELKPKRLAVFRPAAYWQSLIYLECYPDVPTGLYENAREYEEYAVFQDELITRAEYDDGCIFRNGKSIPAEGTELRVRALIPANLIIASRFSPINNNAFDKVRRSMLRGILDGSKSLLDFIDEFEQLPKHPKDS